MTSLEFYYIINTKKSLKTYGKRILTQYNLNGAFFNPFQFYQYHSYVICNPFVFSNYLIPDIKPQILKQQESQKYKLIDEFQNDNQAKKRDLGQNKLKLKKSEKKVMKLMDRMKQYQLQIDEVKNRNVLPNNVNLILSYVRRISKSGTQVAKILQFLNVNQNDEFSIKGFYSYQTYLKQKIDPHKSKKTIIELTTTTDPSCTIFTLKEQFFYNKVCRILLSKFLKEGYKTALLTSGKIQQTNKTDHLKARRYLLAKLCHGLHEDNYFE